MSISTRFRKKDSLSLYPVIKGDSVEKKSSSRSTFKLFSQLRKTTPQSFKERNLSPSLPTLHLCHPRTESQPCQCCAPKDGPASAPCPCTTPGRDAPSLLHVSSCPTPPLSRDKLQEDDVTGGRLSRAWPPLPACCFRAAGVTHNRPSSMAPHGICILGCVDGKWLEAEAWEQPREERERKKRSWINISHWCVGPILPYVRVGKGDEFFSISWSTAPSNLF